METVIAEKEPERTVILPLEFQSSFKSNASLVLTEARKNGIVSTREIAAIMPEGAVLDRYQLKSAIGWLKTLGITLATGEQDLGRRKLPLVLFIKKPAISFHYQRLNEADIKFVEKVATGELETEFDDADLALYQPIFRKFPTLAHEEQIVLVQRREAGDLEAHFRLILHNLKLVLSWALKYQGRGLDLADLMQEGILGLMTGIQKFDWRKGNHLSTYVSWWIRSKITRAITDRTRGIRLPAHIAERYYKIKRATENLEKDLGRQPTHDEIGEKIEMPGRFVTKILFAVFGTEAESLDSNPEEIEGGNSSLHNAIADTDTLSPLSALEAKEELESAVAELRAFLVKLGEILRYDDRQRRMFKMRYGLDGTFFAHPTFERIGQEFGVSRARIQQIVEDTWERLNAAGFTGNDGWLMRKLDQIGELESIVGTFAKI
ncbi:MAG: sigma-70 family RNA polymerase sigma factor [bacterium]|nr:sigma-70 family RNA polymerase sigma factor [bacterium]